jgi:hypothetical protein
MGIGNIHPTGLEEWLDCTDSRWKVGGGGGGNVMVLTGHLRTIHRPSRDLRTVM